MTENFVDVAHQRLIAEQFAATSPRERVRSLERYSVELISRHDAEPLILRYEWLGNIGRANFFVGLVSPDRELHGVACFGHGPASTRIGAMFGASALCLERGACVHYAPANAASFLINAACKLIYRATGIGIFFAYGDPMAGEYGGVYQAAGWIYLGQGLDGGKNRLERYAVLPPGGDPKNIRAWLTTRILRRLPQALRPRPDQARLTFDQARKLGWSIERRPAKHVYAVKVDGKIADRKAWRKKFGGLAYPAPRPELKRRKITGRPVFPVKSPEPI